MIDGFGRNIDYLRVSVTDHCNLRCVYCMPREGVSFLTANEILSDDEICRVVAAAASLGIKKVRLTGGEPLLRQKLWNLVALIKMIPGIETVTLTTNGILLGDQVEHLVQAGLDGVNISLDTLDPIEYRRITGGGNIRDVREGVKKALMWTPPLTLKINCVSGAAGKEHLEAVAGLARTFPVHVRFIEIMPLGLGRQFPLICQEEIVKQLSKTFGPFTPCPQNFGSGPCQYYTVEGFRGRIGFISAMSHRFCTQCNRIRLTADGCVKTCLQYSGTNAIKTLLGQGASEEEIAEALKKIILEKPEGHHFRESLFRKDHFQTDQISEEQRSMFQIGG